jgi:hypothetical protein
MREDPARSPESAAARAAAGQGGGRPARGRALLALAVLGVAAVHAAVVVSVLSQPLDVRRSAPERRSLVFELSNDSVHRIGPGADFFALYRAGVQVRAGRSPYSGAGDAANPPYGYAYRYLPLLAVTLGRAAAALPPRAAWVAWGIANEALLLAFLAFWAVAARSAGERAAGAALLLASTPYFLELHMGQFTFAACALACAALLLFERARGRAVRAGAGALLAAAAALKVFPLVVLPALRRDRAARLAWGVAAAGLLGATLAYGLGAPRDLARFAGTNLVALSPAPQRGNFGMLYTLTAAAREAGLAWTPGLFTAFARGWQILVLGSAALVAGCAPRRAIAAAGGVCLTGFFLAYQDVWEHHYSGALVAGLLVARGVGEDGRRMPRALAWLALAAIATPTPFAWLEASADASWRSWPGWQQWALPLAKSGPLLVLQGLGLAALARTAAWTPGAPRS